jgi:hypothetical protein
MSIIYLQNTNEISTRKIPHNKTIQILGNASATKTKLNTNSALSRTGNHCLPELKINLEK